MFSNNKDKRSFILSLALGDGCIHYVKNAGKVYGAVTIVHSKEQVDYLQWKAKLLSEVAGRPVSVRTTGNPNHFQVQLCMKRIRAWRKFTYPNNKKSISRILRFIDNPEMAAAIWLMDDGYIEPSVSKLADGSKKNYGARMRIFTCDQSDDEQELICNWLEQKLGLKAKVHKAWNKKRGKYYPYIKIGQQDSLKLWGKIREFVLQFKSMKYKFRHIEHIYQERLYSAAQASSEMKNAG